MNCFWRLEIAQHCPCLRTKSSGFSFADFLQMGQVSLKTLTKGLYQPDTMIFCDPKALSLEPPYLLRRRKIPGPWPTDSISNPNPLILSSKGLANSSLHELTSSQNTTSNLHMTWAHHGAWATLFPSRVTHDRTVVKFLLWPNIKGRGVAKLGVEPKLPPRLLLLPCHQLQLARLKPSPLLQPLRDSATPQLWEESSASQLSVRLHEAPRLWGWVFSDATF